MYAGNIRQWETEVQALPEWLRPWIKELASLHTSLLKPGRYELPGANFFNIDEVMTENASARKIEAHRSYIDIQMVLAGREYIGWQPLCHSGKVVEARPDDDIWFYDGSYEDDTQVLMTPGTFAIFLPGDGHRPLCAPHGLCGPVRKIIMKIHI